MANQTKCSDEECVPLDTVYEVLSWKKPKVSWANLVKPLRKRSKYCYQNYPVCSIDAKCDFLNATNVPKTLVCHDMKGGYGADRLVNGCGDLEEYKLLIWSCIDTFVYFSHRFITIPPLCWINAGHTHGVKVLGTLITEGKSGANIWSSLTLDMLNKMAIQLAELCSHYNFDGYLINIENSMSEDGVKMLVIFLENLIKNLKNISPEKEVIWYDSVTYPDGKLAWQNKLNDLNKLFFNMCDGIYLNYGWSEEDLIQSLNYVGGRKTDLYVGIDVFGRGVLGGGGFTSCQAMDLIRTHGLSVAIFAPGWVFEECPNDEIVDNRDFMFWELLADYLYCYGPAELPFQTSFCRGYGLRKYKEGLVVNASPWFNLSEMNHLPAIHSGIFKIEDSSCFLYYMDEAYNGGGCLLIKPQERTKNCKIHYDRLLVCDFYCRKKIRLQIVSKPLITSCKTGLTLILNLVVPSESGDTSVEAPEKQLFLPIEYNVVSRGENEWIRSDFLEDIGLYHIVRIDCMLTGDCHPILIGYISVEEEG